MKKQSRFRELALADSRAIRKSGPICSICAHPSAAKINDDLRELVKLREEGTQISLTWFTEIHCKEEYGLDIGRESMKRHAHKDLGIKV